MTEERGHTITLKLQEGFEFLASFETFSDAAPLLLDEPAPLGRGRGPSAAALLGASIGNCLAASLLFCLRRARADVRGMEANVAIRIGRSEQGRLRIAGVHVTIEPELASQDDAPKLERCKGLFEDYCIVTASVRKAFPVDVEVRPRFGAATLQA